MSQDSHKPDWSGGEADSLELFSLFRREFKPKTEADHEAIERSVVTLAQLALSQTSLLGSDVVRSIEAMIAQIDKKLTEQINHILHHPDLQRLEAAWRGLWFLCSQPAAHGTVVVKVLNLARRELTAAAGGKFFESALVQRIYVDECATPTGTPFGALLADFSFDSTDYGVLNRLAAIGSLAHVPIVGAASPALFGLDSYDQVARPSSLTLTPDAAFWWRQFRTNSAARFVSLALPHVLMRAPYRAGDVGEFDFTEDVGGHAHLLWARPVWIVGDAIVRSFIQNGWFARISEAGRANDGPALPRYSFYDDDGGASRIGPGESTISYAREKEIAALGFIPVVQTADGRSVVVHFAQTAYEKESRDRIGTETRRRTFASDLRGMLCACRFAQAVARFAPGAGEDGLQAWLDTYVARPDESPDASRPLRSASVRLETREGSRFAATATLSIWPAYQFERSEPLELQVLIEVLYPEPLEPQRRSTTPAGPASLADGAQTPGISTQPFQLLSVVSSSESDAVLEAFWRSLDRSTLPRCQVAFGPLTVDAAVDATRPVEELADWVCGEAHRLELPIADVPHSPTLDLSRLGFLVRYPSGVVKGLSAEVDAVDGNYRLVVLDPLALLDPAGVVPARTSQPVRCRFDVLVLEPAPS